MLRRALTILFFTAASAQQDNQQNFQPQGLAVPPPEKPPLSLDPQAFIPEEDEPTTARFNYFDLELFQAYVGHGNVFLSPASIKTTMAMLLEGAKGNTASEIARAIRIPVDPKESRDVLQKILYDLNDRDGKTVLESSNGIFVSKKYEVDPSYRQKLEEFFRAFTRTVDFGNPTEAANLINTWVANSTRGLIPDLISPESLSAESSAVVTNALYFKGAWKHAFDEESTSIKCFYTQKKECVHVYMMHNVETYKYRYIKDLQAYAVELPYEGNYAMVLLIPKDKNGIAFLARDLQHTRFSNVLRQLEPTEIMLWMPRFEIEFSTDLSPALRQLGVAELFTPSANLTGMVLNNKVFVSNIIHKTKIQVNEKGTVAAAASGAVVIPLMGNTLPRVTADHPFAFFIYHTPTDNIVFEGIISEPEEVQNSAIKVKPSGRSLGFEPLSNRFSSQSGYYDPGNYNFY